MSLETTNLRRLLQLFYLPPNRLQAELRKDIRQEIDKENGGGDFYSPFWADAKDHVARKADLGEQTANRIAANSRTRSRLYPLLMAGFLRWWDEKRRWRNEEFEFLASVNARFKIEEIGTVVKVENLIALKVGGEFHRLVYPYFSEDPILSKEAARIGLWLMHQALPAYPLEDLRILDVLRSASFGTIDVPLEGNEPQIFIGHHARVLAAWKKLREEYN
ncbi:hypothetical protein [Rhizobium leguminosarum]|uniref:hypothetical protein n=1 Tax=Rhizobium leguminosarum TaxID=384 RepID=UPI001C9611C7|nr:hypothetical protein [Rhizobium leguminosarum]MBY5519729.1 hypothetical protein [Rhizobium leguminosarum]